MSSFDIPGNFPLPGEVQGNSYGFVFTPGGFILSNSRVVYHGSRMEVTVPDGHRFERDLAVVRIDGPKFPFLGKYQIKEASHD